MLLLSELEVWGEEQGSSSVSMTKNALCDICSGCDRNVEWPRVLITRSWRAGGKDARFALGLKAWQECVELGKVRRGHSELTSSHSRDVFDCTAFLFVCCPAASLSLPPSFHVYAETFWLLIFHGANPFQPHPLL